MKVPSSNRMDSIDHNDGINEIMAKLPAIYCHGQYVGTMSRYPTHVDTETPKNDRVYSEILMGAIAVSRSPFSILWELDIPPNLVKCRPARHYHHYGSECSAYKSTTVPSGIPCIELAEGNAQEVFPFNGATLIVCGTVKVAEEAGELLRSKYPSYLILNVQESADGQYFQTCSDMFFAADIVIVSQTAIEYLDIEQGIANPEFARWSKEPFNEGDPLVFYNFNDLFRITHWDTIIQLHVTRRLAMYASYRNLLVVGDPFFVSASELIGLVLYVCDDMGEASGGNSLYPSVQPSHSNPLNTLSDMKKLLPTSGIPSTMVYTCKPKPIKSARSAL